MTNSRYEDKSTNIPLHCTYFMCLRAITRKKKNRPLIFFYKYVREMKALGAIAIQFPL